MTKKSEIIDKQILHFKDWFYELYLSNNELYLWVYLGGIAEMVREIKLSNEQSEQFKTRGEEFIIEMASELQRIDSQNYSIAVIEKRRVI